MPNTTPQRAVLGTLQGSLKVKLYNDGTWSLIDENSEPEHEKTVQQSKTKPVQQTVTKPSAKKQATQKGAARLSVVGNGSGRPPMDAETLIADVRTVIEALDEPELSRAKYDKFRKENRKLSLAHSVTIINHFDGSWTAARAAAQ